MIEKEKIEVSFDNETVTKQDLSDLVGKTKKFIPPNDYDYIQTANILILRHVSAYEIFAGIVANMLSRDFVIEDTGKNQRLLRKSQRQV